MRNKKITLSKQVGKFDKKLFFLILGFVALGIIAVADVSAPQSLNIYGNKFYLLKQQAISGAIGVVAFMLISRIKYTFWEKVATPAFFASLILLIMVLIQHFGISALGAQRWIKIGPINFQP